MRRSWMVGLSLTLAMTVACGKSDAQIAAEKTAEEAKVAAEAVKKAAESAASSGVTQGLEGFAKAMEGVAGMANALGGAPGGKPVDPISFKELQTALPEVAGWERQKPTGERMTMPVAFSQAEARYTKGEARVEVKIVDSAFHQLLVAPWSMFLTVGYEKETSDGYEKSVNVSGSPGFEKWNDNRKDGELNLVVAKRFLVTVEGDGVGDIAVLREFASKLDTGKLASLK